MVVAAIYIQQSDACSCNVVPNFPFRYCAYGLVFRGEVKNETLDRMGNLGYEDKYVYTVKVKKTYKATELAKERISKDDTVQLETPKYGSLCGRPLRVGGDYLISVTRYEVTLNSAAMAINMCEWIEEFDNVSLADKYNLENDFECPTLDFD